jgi:hypothetical protein
MYFFSLVILPTLILDLRTQINKAGLDYQKPAVDKLGLYKCIACDKVKFPFSLEILHSLIQIIYIINRRSNVLFFLKRITGF